MNKVERKYMLKRNESKVKPTKEEAVSETESNEVAEQAIKKDGEN
jgi:ribosomal protein S24E